MALDAKKWPCDVHTLWNTCIWQHRRKYGNYLNAVTIMSASCLRNYFADQISGAVGQHLLHSSPTSTNQSHRPALMDHMINASLAANKQCGQKQPSLGSVHL